MEKNWESVLGKNQFMKKRILVALAIFTASVSFAQQKKQIQPPSPPPPPEVRLKKFTPPPPPPKVVRERFPSSNDGDYQAFLKNNPTVKGIGWSENKVRIHLKSGKQEVYDLNNEEDVFDLKNKYGELPAPPPPPPPPKVSKIKTAS
jgi:hypothetical protein